MVAGYRFGFYYSGGCTGMAINSLPLGFWLSAGVVVIILYLITKTFQLRWQPALFARVVLVVLILIGIFLSLGSNPKKGLPHKEILILDQSDSISETDREEFRVLANAWQDLRENRLVVGFAQEAKPIYSDEWPLFTGDSSNLSGAFDLARELMGKDSGRVILVSDGAPDSISQVEEQVKGLLLDGDILDIFPLNPLSREGDLYLGQIRAPSRIWENSEFYFSIPIFSPTSGEAIVQLFMNDEKREEQTISVTPGENLISLSSFSGDPGILTLQVVVLVEGDLYEDNNVSFASLEVLPNPHVMMVTQDVGAGIGFRRALSNQGVQIDFFLPVDVPIDLEALSPYQVIIVHNVLARDFSLEQMKALERFVSDIGGGLIFLGGRNAYTLGGYQNTPFEKILPVNLTPPDRSQSAPITFVMVLDRSGSMLGRPSDLVSPIDLTKEAAMRVIESLRSEDYLGVLSFSGTSQWDVDIRQLGSGVNLRLAQDAVSQISVGGGTLMYQALQEAITNITSSRSTDHLHIMLMSDGISGDGTKGEFRLLAKQAQEQDITISTIAFGNESDSETLELIAEYGGGRFYEVLDPNGLPEVMIAESVAAHNENVQPGKANLIAGEEDHPVLSGFSLVELPEIGGYHSVSSKPESGAEDILLSGNYRDPVLSARQVGLGRVITWMSDIGEEWAGEWKDWNRQGEFWVNVIRYAVPDPTLSPTQVDVKVTNAEVIVTLQMMSSAGVPINLATPQFMYVDKNGKILSFTLSQTGPGFYQSRFPLPPFGAYRGAVRFEGKEGIQELSAPFAVDYPKEWQPIDPNKGEANLLHWAAMTGGKQIDLYEEISQSLEEQGEANINVDVLIILLIILVVSWPLEIAARRRWMPWQ